MRRTLNLVLIFILLFAQIGTANWQGTGNFTQNNITLIRTYIDTNFNPHWSKTSISVGGDQTLINLAKGLSDKLNDEWA